MQDPTVHEDDLALVRDVLKDRKEAIAVFIERMQCVPRILAAQNARMGRPLDEHDLADLVQDTMIVLWRKLPEYRGRAQIEGWVYRVCVLELMNGVKKKRRRTDLTEVQPDSIEPEGDEAEPSWEYEDLHAGLARLPDEEAEVIRLKHFEAWTLAAIAQASGTAESTIKTRYYRGLSRLQDYLESEHAHQRDDP